jgi:putative phosphoribosyl transferase
MSHEPVQIPVGPALLQGELCLPRPDSSVVVFAHGSGSSRHSGRNLAVAAALRDAGLGTLLFDLLTEEEEAAERYTRHLRFDIPLLTDRLIRATDWLRSACGREVDVGYFGASTGAAAALRAAALACEGVRAVVSRGGRPDLAGDLLSAVRAPTLLIVGGADAGVIELNRDASSQLRCTNALEIVPGASHLFEEAGALEAVSELATDWFARWLGG